MGASHFISDKIVKLLGEEWPLSAKQVFGKLESQGMTISYQRVHKILKELDSSGVISRDGNNYCLNKNWVSRKKKELEELEQKLHGNSCKNKIFYHIFSSYKEFGHCMLEMLNSLEKIPNEKGYCVFSHMWSTMTLSKEEVEWFSELGRRGGTILCNGNSLLDKYLKTMWEKIGFKVILDSNYPIGNDTVVYGENIFQVMFPKEVLEGFLKIFAKAKNPKELDMKKYYELFYKETKIVVTQLKDKELAEQTKKSIEKAANLLEKSRD